MGNDELSEEEQRRRLGRVPWERQTVELAKITTHWRPREPGVNLEQREGVYIHSFVCNNCGLHFNLYSWVPDRQRCDSIHCPECGQHEGAFQHYRAQISESTALSLDHPGEVFRHCPAPGYAMMNDSNRKLRRRENPAMN